MYVCVCDKERVDTWCGVNAQNHVKAGGKQILPLCFKELIILKDRA